jgi:FtsZ-binding cell division protein ZapB
MTETKAQWEPAGLERFSHLEDKIFRVVEAFKTIRKENETLRADNTRLKDEVETLRESETTFNETLTHLQKEREELRERVEKALNLLATLEMK